VERNKQTILVVDDNSLVCGLVKSFLETAGYAVLMAGGARAAMLLYEEHKVSIAMVLTDVVMPETGGLELADWILQRDPRQRVLFMSGSEQSVSRGFGCVAKPFKRAELIGRVAYVLEGPPPGRAKKAAVAS
jgi:CheY-like chemotaxis protein